MNNKAIRFENVSKQYRLGSIGTGTLSHDLNRWWHKVRGLQDPYLRIGDINDRSSKGNSEYIWALRDINYELAKGEVLGIIGKNGAGKSTLLKILSKVTKPTTGLIRTNGRIASLLEVGTGFHQEMTGRENIFMNGSIMGMTKAEIRKKMDEIVDFSGVERYIDTPVKRYSSGMTVRLGFAIAAHLEPEILVVDEVLAVGDAEFQKKAIGKMQDVSRNKERTVLFVSHNMSSILNLCQTGMLLENGLIAKTGPIAEVVDYYLKNQEVAFDQSFVRIDNSHRRFNTIRQLEFISVERLNNYQIASDEPLKIRLTLRNNSKMRSARLSGMLCYEDSNRVGVYFTREFEVPADKDEFQIETTLYNHNLARGKYYFDFNIGMGDHTTAITDYDVIYRTVSFEVEYDSVQSMQHINYWSNYWGRNCYQNIELKINPI